MDKAQQSQRSKYEQIILIAVVIVVSLGVAYMAYDYVTTMEQLDNRIKETTENLSLNNNSSINSDLGYTDT